MQDKLPGFENRHPRMSALRISGEEFAEMLGAFEFDEEVTCVVRLKIKKVSHEERKLGEDDIAFTRAHQAPLLELVPIPNVFRAKQVLADARSELREFFGKPELFDEQNKNRKAKEDNVDPETGEVKPKKRTSKKAETNKKLKAVN